MTDRETHAAIMTRVIQDEGGGVSPQDGIGAILLVTLIAILASLGILYLAGYALSQEGRRGEGHEHWHERFYSTLLRNDTKTSCCNLADCSPTTVRVNGDRYEVMVDGEWVAVLPEKIVKVSAPDNGAHVCAPKCKNGPCLPHQIYCVVLPPET